MSNEHEDNFDNTPDMDDDSLADEENVSVDTFHQTGEIPLPPPDEPYTPAVEEENETDIELPPPLPPLQPYGSEQQPPPPVKKNANSNKKRKRKKKRKRSRLPGVLILTTFIFGLSVVLALVIIGFGKDMFGIGKSDKTHLIVIPENATTEEIAAMLENDGIIKSPKFFTIFSQLRSAEIPYIAGEHFVRPNMAYETIINELTSVEEEDVKESVEVTFPEGITIIDAAKILQDNGVCSAEDFIFYFNSGGYGYEFENHLTSDTSIKFMRMEGYLFPDTYYFFTDMEPEQVCQKIYMNFDQKMTEARWEKINSLELSLDEIITMASIVQKEAATTGTMTLVASVFWNRLRNKDVFPLLQSDPTSNYANDVVRPNMEVVDETIVNSYDTYKSPGLPPGAICNPGIDAIDAVLEDYKSNYFYFIANINTKQTYFAETLEEHYANEELINEQYAAEKAANAENAAE